MSNNNNGRPSMFSKEEDAYILDNYLIKTSGEIGAFLGYSAKQIQSRAKILGLRKNRVFDNRYFENIDTSEKAYWLGFLYADGWVVYNDKRKNYEVGIELQRNDKYMLERLNNTLGGAFTIKDIDKEHVFVVQSYCDVYTSVLRMYSKSMAMDLISHGVVPNKTYKKEYPVVSDDLFADFFRGYFDGNGCIYDYVRKTTGRSYVQLNITTPNDSFALYCHDKLQELYDIETGLYHEQEFKNRVVITQMPKIAKLCEIMYANPTAPKLLRKYDIYNSNFGPQAEQSA